MEYLITQRSQLNNAIETSIVEAENMLDAYEIIEGPGSYSAYQDAYDASDVKILIELQWHSTQVEVLSNVLRKSAIPTIDTLASELDDVERELHRIAKRLKNETGRQNSLNVRRSELITEISELEE